MRLEPPREVVAIAKRLEGAGFETWCVGGAVRDALLGHAHLGHAHLDWDLATAAKPAEVRRLFKRTIPVGLEFGTVGVVDRDGRMHEVTTFRRDVRTDGRHAEVEFGASLDEDLARRDFTINAIAYSPSRDALHDPFGGRADLHRRLVRAVGDPARRMEEDHLRALRALRFAGRFDFQIEPGTWRAIVDSAPHLGRLSAERIKQELEKTMDQVTRPSTSLRRWIESGAMRMVIPDLAGLSPIALATLDCLPMPGLSGRPQRRVNRLTALFLDVEPVRAEAALKGLRFSRTEGEWIAGQVERWRSVGSDIVTALGGDVAPPDRALRRWVARIGRTRTAPMFRVAAARWAALHAAEEPAPPATAVRSFYRRSVRTAYRDAIEIGDLAVDGEDLMRVGIPPGPQLGKILHELLDRVIDDPSQNSTDHLAARAMELYERSNGTV